MVNQRQTSQATIDEEKPSNLGTDLKTETPGSQDQISDEKADLKKAEFQPLTPSSSPTSAGGIDLLMDVSLPVVIEIGRTTMLVKDIVSLGEGSVIETEKPTTDPVDVIIGGKLFARGEVVVLNGRFGVRITELADGIEETKA